MAGLLPSLTNESFHEFQPSALETTLASALSNKDVSPLAFPLYAGAVASNQQAGDQYQQQINQMHQTQMQQFEQGLQLERNKALIPALKDAGQTPGMVQALNSGGFNTTGADLSGIDNGANTLAAANIIDKAGTGFGRAALGGITGLGPAASALLGPGVSQGPVPLVQAAGINAAGRIGAAQVGQGGVTVSMPYGDVGPNQPTIRTKVPVSNLSQAVTSLQNASQAPTQTAPNTIKSPAQLQQSITAALPNIQAANPAVYNDIIAGAINGAPNVIKNPHGAGYIIQGKSGQYSGANF